MEIWIHMTPKYKFLVVIDKYEFILQDTWIHMKRKYEFIDIIEKHLI